MDSGTEKGLCNTPATLWSMCLSLPRHHKAFLILVMVQAVLVVVYRTYLLAAHAVTVDSLWFYMLMIVSALFVAYFAVHATLFANSFELFAFLVASMFMLLRLIIGFVDQSSECSGNERTSCEVMFGITATFNVVTWFFCYRMQADLRWKKYKAIGADLATIKMYKVYELFVAVRKLDLQFSAIMVLTGFIFFEFSAEERAFLIPNVIIFCIELAWERFGFMGVRRQNRSYLIAFFVLSTPLPIFVIVVGMLTFSSYNLFNEILHSASIVKLGITAAALIINRICTVTIAVILFRNFGPGYRGLRTIFDKENDKWLQLQAITAGGGNEDFNKVGGSNDVELGTAAVSSSKKPKKQKKPKKRAADTGALADELEAGSPNGNGAGAGGDSGAGNDAGSSSDEEGASPTASRPAAGAGGSGGDGSNGGGSKKKKKKKSSKQDKKKKKKKNKKHKSGKEKDSVVSMVNPMTA